jgi:benzil reductase ((S)-benzoin forming)
VKLYIVTGATRGLGKALVEALARDPANEIITLSRAADASMGQIRNYQIELARLAEIAAVFGRAMDNCALPHYDKIVLYNNAGVLEPVGPLTMCDDAQIETALQVNLAAPIILMRHFIARTRAMCDARLIVNISSGAGRRPVAAWTMYCATKAGLDMATRVAGLEAERFEPGLSVCSVAPGVVDTSMQERVRAVAADVFPDVVRFRKMKEEGKLRTPEEASAILLEFEAAGAFQNGGIHDVREMSHAAPAAPVAADRM